MSAEEQSGWNIARYFTRNRHIAWVALFATMARGVPVMRRFITP